MTANITEAEYRNDGAAANALALLGNRMTGLGQRGRDKYLEHAIELNFTPLQRQELQALYRKSKICEKVVDLLPKAATANNWLEVTIGKGRKGIPAKAVQYSEDLKLRSAVREAGIMGRLDGDGFVLLGVDDGGKPWEPINEGRIRRISWVYPVDRWRLLPDNLSGRPGHPEYYSLYLPFTEALPDQQTNGKVHCSRVLRFPGKRLWGAMITENTGYNDSVLQTFFQSFVRYLIAIEYSTRMIQDYNVFTYKLQGLAQLILAGDEEKIFHRFQAILTSLSSLGGLAMDADKEDAQFISRNFSGLDVLIDRLKDDTSAAAAMPPTQLWGSSQKAALSNSSEGDKYAWADCIADYRSEILEEPISDFFRLVFLAQNGPTGGRLPESWGISYRSALRLNLKEQTELRATQTEKVDVPSIQAGILLKEEVRESAWAGSDYTIERQLQPALYTKQQAAAEEQQQPEPDEGSEAEADNQEEKPEADDASVNSLSDVFDAVDRTDDEDLSHLDAWHEDAMFYEWHEDANGVPCGKGWIRAGHKCSKGVSASHPAHNPNHSTHAALQGALAAANGAHDHAAASSDHPDHAAYKSGFAVHGGKGEITPQKQPKAKAVHEMTAYEWGQAKRSKLMASIGQARKSQGSSGDAAVSGSGKLSAEHREVVEKAIAKGKTVPDHVIDSHHMRWELKRMESAGVSPKEYFALKHSNAPASIKAFNALHQIVTRPEAKPESPLSNWSDRLQKLERMGTTGVGRADSPFAQTGGTSRTDADANPITTIIDRADKHLSGLEDSAIERVNSALESAYQALEATILRGYSLETPGSLMARDRALVLLSQVTDLLTLLNTRKADDIQQAFEDLLRGAEAQGVTLAQDLTRAIANQSLQMTANVPIEALQNQATEGMTRLRNHTNAFADKASTIVTQGLIQGWGTDKVASLLQRELGVVRHKAETIARTESLSASNAAIAATLAANDYTLFQFFATKDDRVCPFCSARNQNVYKLGESQPPLHPRCRCVMVGFKQEHLALGLIDTAWSQNFREGAIAELKAQGLEPNDGLAPFEKANGFEAPVAIWEPGQREDEWREDAGTPCGKGWIKVAFDQTEI